MVRTVFAKMQPFKGVKNYFTDSLVYQENGKIVKKSLPCRNKVDPESELGEDPTTFDEEPIVAYFNDIDFNNFAKNDGEWVLNENINFDYSLYFDGVYDHVNMSPLYMPPPMLTACMHVKDKDGSVFIVSSSKNDQSPIIWQSLTSDCYIE